MGPWETVKQEIDAQLALVSRLRMMLSRSADEVAAQMARVENPLAKVEAMTRIADIMTRVARTASDLKRMSSGESAGTSVDDLLKEDL